MSTVTILALGDSNTAYGQDDGTGWALKFRSGLATWFPGTTFNLVNKGVSGQNTQQMIDALPVQLAGQQPHIVAIMTGTNDGFLMGYTCTGDPNNFSVDPVWTLTDPNAINNYDGQLTTIINAVEALSNSTAYKPLVLLMSPPPAASYPDQINGGSILSWAYTRPKRNIDSIVGKVATIAASRKLPYANINNAISSISGWLNQGGSDYLVYDGVHMNPSGRQIAANTDITAVLPWLDHNGLVAGQYVTIDTASEVVSGAVSISGTMRSGATVAVTCVGATIGTVTYPTSTTWECEVLGLTLGANTITATGSDIYGSGSQSVSVDRLTGSVIVLPRILTAQGWRVVIPRYEGQEYVLKVIV